MADQGLVSITTCDPFFICGTIHPVATTVPTLPGNKFYVYNKTFILKYFREA